MYVCAVQPTFPKYRLCSSADRLNLAPRIASLISWRTELRSRLFSRLYPNKSQGWPGFLGIQYIWVFNFRYTAFLFLKLGIKYSLTTNFGYKVYRVFLNLSILHEFYRNFWYILEGLFRVFWYSTSAPWPTLKSNGSRGMKKSRAINPASYAGYSKDSPHNSLNNKPHLQVCTSVLKQLWTGFAVCMFKPSFRDTFLGFCS